jgi:hypothetical protein
MTRIEFAVCEAVPQRRHEWLEKEGIAPTMRCGCWQVEV